MTTFPTALHHRLQRLARLEPDAPALASFEPETVRLTRGELDLRAARLAAVLRRHGVGIETRVGVCIERSCDLIVALLAVLKAGGAFVPLDPSLPAARLEWMARDAGARIALVSARGRAPALAGLVCVDVDAALDTSVVPLDLEPTHPQAAAYLIYTSGSTGTPKAVVVEHGPLAAHCDAVVRAYPMHETDRVLHFAAVGFDLAHEYWLAPLAAGASIVVTGAGPLEPRAALRLIEREGVAIAAFPPAYLQEVARAAVEGGAPPALRVLAFGGEAMASDRFERVRAAFPGVRFINGYGPTETVISPMLWPVEPSDVLERGGAAALPIGRTIGPRSARLSVRGDGEGAAGELLLGGACLARGYHGRPALTAERFIPDAHGNAGARVYRTGDLARLRDDGAFDYLGRLDDQVQVRGIRVEPGEIEQALLAHAEVRDAAVLADKSNGGVRLLAFVSAGTAIDETQLRDHLARHIPQAWIPARMLVLDALPRALSGKLDRQALLALAGARSPAAPHRAPSDATACALARIWHAIVGGPAIGLDDRFFLRGGDSIGVMQMQSAIRAEWGVHVPLGVLFDDNPLEQVAALVASRAGDALKGERLVPDERAGNGEASGDSRVIDIQAPYAQYPASLAQRRFWVVARIGDAAHAYHIAAHWHVEGRVDAQALSRALAALVRRHDAWRTTLAEDDEGNVVQRVHANVQLPLESFDLRAVDPAEREARAGQLARQWAEAPFDLSGGPLLRAALVTVDEQRHCLMLTLHHAIGDGWSSRIAFDELAEAYTAVREGREPAWPALPLRYAEFARRQMRWLDEGARENQLAYWRGALAEAPGALALPVDRAVPAERTLRGMRATRRLSPTVSRTIRSLARETHSSVFIVLLAALHAWLYRLTGTTDVVVAAPVATRRESDLAALVGLFVNTVAVRARVAPQAAFSALLAQVREATLGAYEHSDVPFDEVLDAVAPPVRRGAEWLRVKFAQQFLYGERVDLPGATARLTPGPDGAARFDFAVDFTDDPLGIEFVAAWATDCIDDDTGRGWLESFAALVEHAVREPSAAVCELASHREPSAAVALGRSEVFEFSDVLEAFSHHAARTPDRVAVSDDARELTFAALDAVSSNVAHALRARGIGAECAVALGIERSVDFVVSLLGVMKAGATAVPLDPAAPVSRVAQCLAACSPRCLIVADPAPSWHGLSVASTRLSELESTQVQEAPRSLTGVVARHADQAAYLIFTSGSTGAPKGVIVSHRALADYAQGMLATLEFAPGASMAMTSTVAADLGHTTLFGALCAGRTLHLLSPGCAFDPDRFAQAMRSRNVGVLKIVPSHLRALLEATHPADVLPAHALVLGGEPLPQALAMRIAELKSTCRIVNHYGPTEASVGALTFEFRAREAEPARVFVATGRPLPNVRACVLDSLGAPVPVGGYGELFLGGPGLARGYVSRPAATAERFVPDPAGPAGERLYRTGDRARIRADGVIEWAGRLDDQVKIRGYRVEPGEVSAALAAIETVVQAETLAVQDERGMRLVSFATLDRVARLQRGGPDGAQLRARLAERLPDYMVPASVVVLDTLPVTANGKADRARLRDLAKTADLARAHSVDEPRDGLENALAQVWKDVLRLDRVGRDENFFSLGGDSIVALQVIARSRKAGIRFTPKQLFDHPTLARLAEVAARETGGLDANAQRPADGSASAQSVALTPAQHRFFALDVPNPHHWNQAIELEPQGMFDVDAFAEALGIVLTHHDVFRLRFAKSTRKDGGWHAMCGDRAFELLPLSVQDARDRDDALARFDALQRTIDLTRGPLARALVATLPDGTARVFVALHHLIVDGVSWRIVLEDLQTAYEAALTGIAPRLPAPASATAPSWAARLRQAASTFEQERSYWLAVAGTGGAFVGRSVQAAPPANATARTIVRALTPQLTQSLLTDANLAWRTQTQDLLLAALADALGGDGADGANGVCLVELEGHGREALFDDVDASRTLGWLTSHYPVALPIGSTLVETLTAVKDTMRAVPNRGLGFGVLRYLGDEATRAQLAALPKPRVTFNYLGRFEAMRGESFSARFGGVGCERDPAGPMTNALAVHAFVDEARVLRVHWVYSAEVFDDERIAALVRRFEDALASLAQACRARVAAEGGGATPGDFPLARRAGLTQAAIDAARLDWRTVDDIYPLSPMQQGILFQSLLAPEQAIYVNQLVATLDAPDLERLTAAFERAIARHDILRTSFLADIDPPLQVVHRRAVLPVAALDWRDTCNTREADVEQWLMADRARGFVLSEAPLMRLTLIRLSERTWRLVWTRHHLLLDGWSTARLFAEVLNEYAQGQQAPVFRARQGTRYRDFIAWLGARDEEGDRAFWLERLARLEGPTLVAPVPSARVRSAYGRWHARLDAATTEALVACARRLHVTVNTVLQGAWAVTLQRMTHQHTVAFGATVAGRPDALHEVDAVLGLFINTLPVVATPSPNVAIADWLAALQRESAACAEHAHTPLFEIQRWAGRNAAALFDTLIVFENYPVDEAWARRDDDALRFSELRNVDATDFAVTLVVQAGEQLSIDYGFDRAKLTDERVQALHRALMRCLTSFIADAGAPLGSVSIATRGDIAQLARWNATSREWLEPQRAPLHRQFERQAALQPDATALLWRAEHMPGDAGPRRMTYAELDARADRVAVSLREAGATLDAPIALCLNRSAETVVALLGVMKAGAAWLPIDPDYPAARIAYMLEDARPACIVTQRGLLDRVSPAAAGSGTVVHCIDQLETWPHSRQAESLAAASTGDRRDAHEAATARLAYLIYTSGSTGRPKGAGNTHAALANRIAWMQDAYALTSSDVVLQKTPFGFDVSVWEFLWPLSAGATLALAAPGSHREPARLVDEIEALGVTTIHFVPSMLAAFLGYLESFGAASRCGSLVRIVSSGEALAGELAVKATALMPQAAIHNLYGPTEAAIDVSHWTWDALSVADAVSVPIGMPIANTQLHVLDAALQPVPVGAIGELYLGGVGLARGYYRRPSLTAERFVPDPFAAGGRLYRTGDLVTRRADGALEYLGRIDSQVKLRGQRIEPGEIEAVLRTQPGIDDVVVIVRDEQLIAYVARARSVRLDQGELLARLQAQLPAYMVPARLIELDALPVTPNGKCDRAALPAPASVADAVFAAPASETERELAAIWGQVLRAERIGRDDDFFLRGGHSLLAAAAHARTNRRWSVALPLRTLFEARTLARCAALIDAELAAQATRGHGDAVQAIGALLDELEAN
ncbi:non-ribosomal peptide synthetase [Trinickia diaoshuihuensis]|uniref:non-ribosomal peptide synthetase n=1 Tax=Trinickia diaoshuihuensis TaxID=2292265 RepID=UPI000E248D69|nr:non-ribosomal peptide synthetase [Trinickia diaoshuihuensis]